MLATGGRPTNLDYGRTRAYCACSRCELGLYVDFLLPPTISLFFLPLSGMDGWMTWDFSPFQQNLGYIRTMGG